MKKVFAGAVFGLLMGISITAYGAGGVMVGKKIDAEFPLWLHGNKLDKGTISIEGTSYAPVRLISEKMGLDVAFKDGQVFLNRRNKEAALAYKIASTLFKTDAIVNTRTLRDEEWYVPVGVFGSLTGGVDWDGVDTVTVTMPWGAQAIFTKSAEYYPGIPGFQQDGRAYVSLTALGLKPVIEGDTMELVRIE